MKLISFARSFAFPERCPYCGKLVEPEENACADCREMLIERQAPIIRGARGFRCVSSFIYAGRVRRLILQIKEQDRTQFIPQVAAVLAEDIQSTYGGGAFDIITAVPMYRTVIDKRKYNQSDLLAKALSKRLGIPYRKTLRKVKRTKKQHEISYQERKVNLKGAFKVIDKAPISGKRILIVDDVITSGNTLGICCKELNKAKPELICCATVASTVLDYPEAAVI